LATLTCSKILVGLIQKLKSNADQRKAVPLVNDGSAIADSR